VLESDGSTPDLRHLLLLADLLTHSGKVEGLQPFRGRPVPSSDFNKQSFIPPSPLREAAESQPAERLLKAAAFSRVDTLATPSARAIVGQTPSLGSGFENFDLLMPVTSVHLPSPSPTSLRYSP